MNTFSRRSVFLFAGAAALPAFSLVAKNDHGGHHGDHHDDDHHDDDHVPGACGTPSANAEIVPYESDIPFDLAYIDTMIPHHESVVMLSEVALDVLNDERLVELAQAVIDTQPGEMEMLMQFRNEWYPDETLEISDDRMMEMMMITMAGQDACNQNDHDAHMDLMDGEKLADQLNEAEDKDLRFIDLVIPHHQMAVHQSVAGLQLAEHEELRDLCEEVIRVQTEEIETLREIRQDLKSAR